MSPTVGSKSALRQLSPRPGFHAEVGYLVIKYALEVSEGAGTAGPV